VAQQRQVDGPFDPGGSAVVHGEADSSIEKLSEALIEPAIFTREEVVVKVRLKAASLLCFRRLIYLSLKLV
jgi:hypothetical protein